MSPRLVICALLLPVVALAQPAPAAAPRYDAAARTGAITAASAAIAALGGEGARALERELSSALRQGCPGGRAPSAACALAVAQRVCASRPAGAPRTTCLGAADVALVIARGADDWVDEATRVRLVRSAADYHRALIAELELRFLALAAELVLEEQTAPSPAGQTSVSPGAPSPAVIDAFCARRDHRPRPPRCSEPSSTCVPSVSWQRCVAALVWISSVPAEPAPGVSP